MLKLNFIIALRNFRKYKGYTALNIIGLSLGLSGVVFMLLYINYERSDDKWDPTLANVYQVQEIYRWGLKDGIVSWEAQSDQRIMDILPAVLPGQPAMTSLQNLNKQSVLIGDGLPFIEDVIYYATDQFFDVFPYQFLYGDATTALAKPSSVVISETFAKAHFAGQNPVGKTISLVQQNWTPPANYVVTGVIRDTETPASIRFNILLNYERRPTVDDFIRSGETYIRTEKQLDLSIVNNELQEAYAPMISALIKRVGQDESEFNANGVKPTARLVPLHEIHGNPLKGKSWHAFIKPIALLSILLLAISVINFINMFTAQAAGRAKEVAVRKVIGANRPSLIKQFLLETTLQCITALFIGVVLLEAALPYLNKVFALQLSVVDTNLSMSFQLVGLIVLVILLAGIYPSWVLSALNPDKALKGNYFQGLSGAVLRRVLVGLQFIIAIGFFAGILIINRQIAFLEKRDPGFDAESVINIRATPTPAFSEALKRIDGVRYVGHNNGIPSFNQNMDGEYKYKGETKKLKTVLVDRDGLQALDVRLVKGRLFDHDHAQDSVNTLILNESLEKAYGGNMVGKFIAVNDSINCQVIGVIKDVQIAGFEQKIQPTVYTAAKVNATGYPNRGVNYVVKFDAKRQKEILAEINNVWLANYPNYPLTYSLLKDELQKYLIQHTRFKKMVDIFSAMAIMLSLIGLFSLAAFMISKRTKEIAIRKVLGADEQSIYFLLNKGYVWLIFIANVIACPLVYIALNYWLKDFAYRIDMPLTPFIVALMASLIITLFTVSFQVRKAMKANPVNALKYE